MIGDAVTGAGAANALFQNSCDCDGPSPGVVEPGKRHEGIESLTDARPTGPTLTVGGSALQARGPGTPT